MPVWILIAAVILTSATDADVTAKKLDGTTVPGSLQSWQDGRIGLQTASGPQQLDEADLLAVEHSFPAAPAGDAETHKPLVQLVDGTALPIADYSTTGKMASVSPRRLSADDSRPFLIDVKKVKSVRLQPMTEAIVKQWQEVQASGSSGDVASPSDLLVVFKRGGQSLDYLDGVIGLVTGRDVEFTHDGNTVRVGRDKVAGLVYFRANSASEESPRCVLTGPDELIVRGGKVQLEDGKLQIVTLSGANIRWPWSEISAADFSAGKLVFLSDMKPVSQSWQPLVALPASATHAAGLGQPRFDHAAVGGPLSLWYQDGDQSPATGHAESFDKGLALRSRTEIAYRLPRGFSHFDAIAGIEPATRSSGDVALTILGDDRPLWEHSVVGADAPLPIDVDVAGIKQLKIVVDYGKNLDTGDWLNLCNARLVK